jgi:FkbM family methyltransferase
MNMLLRKAFRSIQVFFPLLKDAKIFAQFYFNATTRRILEPDFSALSLFKWPADAVFVDIGANRGFSIQAMRLIVPHARIESFEPNPVAFHHLQKIYGGMAGVHLHGIGLSDRAMDTVLWVPVYRQWIFDGLGSLDRDEAYRWLSSDRMYFFNERHLKLRQYPCSIRTLDEFELEPVFIKIDVQGLEPEVLRGAEATLRRSQPLLMIENPESAVDVAFLKEAGYTMHAYENGRFVPGHTGKVNGFFLTDRHLRQLP